MNRLQKNLGSQQSEKLQIFLSCRNIVNGKNIYIALYIEQLKNNKFLGQTQIQYNNQNPQFTKTFIVQLFFETKQKLIFLVYNKTDKGKQLIGENYSRVGQTIGSKNNTLIKPIINKLKQKKGLIIIRCQNAQKQYRKYIYAKITVKNLLDQRWFLQPRPFFIFKRNFNEKEFIKVYESEYSKGRNYIQWDPINISIRKLCNDDLKKPIMCQVFDHNSNGKHKFLGQASFTIQKILNGQRQFNICKQKKVLKKKQCLSFGKQQSSLLYIKHFQITQKYSFQDYILGGVQLNIQIYIDFTGSNLNPNLPQSLHYINPNYMNQYQIVLKQVGQIIQDYDHDKLIPVYGFGAKIKFSNMCQNKVSHCFPLNCNKDHPEQYKIMGVMQAYCNCVPFLQFSGPTYFSPLIMNSMKKAQMFKNQNSQKYLISLILTDGQIYDEKEVIDLLIASSKLPVSYIVVGVGNGDFSIMQKIDDDKLTLRNSKGQKNLRDNLHFLPFNKFHNDGIQLAKQLLNELPHQLQQYMRLEGIKPNKLLSPNINKFIQQIQYKQNDKYSNQFNFNK